MSKSIQDRVKHLETVVKSCCNRFFKLKEQVDTLETTVEDLTSDVSIALDLKADKVLPEYSMRVNNTGVPAQAESLYFRQNSLAVYTGNVTWVGTTAPSGTTSHSYNWQRVGDLVTLNITLVYQTPGLANTNVIVPLLPSMPTPVIPDGLGVSLRYIYPAYGKMSLNEASITTAVSETAMRINAGFDGYELVVGQASTSAKILKITCQYFTA